jgi:hypothetical protein
VFATVMLATFVIALVIGWRVFRQPPVARQAVIADV